MFWTVSLPEVVVDPVDLGFGKDGEQDLVQVAAGREVVAEGLLDHGPHPAVLDLRQPLGAEELDDGLVGVRRRREVEDPVARSAPFALDPLEGRF